MEVGKQINAGYGSGLSLWSHKPKIAGSNPAPASNTNMKKYVVAYLHFQDNEMIQKIVHAESPLEAATQLMLSEAIIDSDEIFSDLEDLQVTIFDRDINVGVIEI